MNKLVAFFSGAAIALGMTTTADAGVRAGVLRCLTAPSQGVFVGSTQEARCVFTSAYGHRENYVAKIERLGPDVGIRDKAVLVWAVYAPTSLRRHALRGDYVGASADVSFGVGAGANVLVGGSGRTVSLQPVSVKAQTGLAVGAGAARLQLR